MNTEEKRIRSAFKEKNWNAIKTSDSWQIFKIMSEFVEGFETMSKIGPCVSVFGSARTKSDNKVPIILWNHRWEYDKNPIDFFKALYLLQEKNLDFEVVVLGENFRKIPEEFEIAKEKLKDKILFMGYADSFKDYATWLWKAHILPVTSNQDFFGGSVIEAIYCNCYPILPNRLAYPEHLLNQENCFYNTFNDLCQKLEAAILNFSTLENQSQFVKKYNWKEIVIQYDEKLKQIKKL